MRGCDKYTSFDDAILRAQCVASLKVKAVAVAAVAAVVAVIIAYQ
jgi:hypothetical protein